MPGDLLYQGFPSGSDGKESACSAGNPGLRSKRQKFLGAFSVFQNATVLHHYVPWVIIHLAVCQFPGYFSSLTGHPVPNPRHMLDVVILLLATDFSVH